MEKLVNAAYLLAKRWAGVVVVLQAVLYLVGVLAVFVLFLTLSYPWIALPLALVGAWVSGRASKFKGAAETLKRQHEHWAAFGQAPSNRQLADWRVDLPDQIRADLDRLLREGITYSSEKPVGPLRALENLAESAWFSKHLARSCATGLCIIFAVSLALAVSLLLLSATTLAGSSVGIAAAKCVSATLLFLISVGTLRSWLAYHRFSQKAGEIDAEACRLSAEGDPDPCEAYRLLTEYQIARASAPLIPTFVWRWRQRRLNENWALRRP
jgi:hypothetical protein